MKKSFLLFAFFFLFLATARSQVNLVPNPSFETFTDCNGGSNILVAYPWYQPTMGHPDYCNACDTTNLVGVPTNYMGYQNAKTGDAYALLGTNVIYNFYEYIGIKLLDSLKAGNRYYFSMLLSLTDSSNYATDDIGAYFSKDSIYSNDYFPLSSYTPQIVNPEGNFITDKINWVKISESFIAQGGEQFLTIGTFKDTSNTSIMFIGGGDTTDGNHNAVSFYIDDICISTDSISCGFTNGTNQIKIQNPFKIYLVNNSIILNFNRNMPLQNCSFSLQNCYLTIYDVMGRELKKDKITEYQFTIQTNSFCEGIYFLRINCEDKIFTQKIFL